MPISTHLTGLLRVEHPILVAPMDAVADGRLAATVSRMVKETSALLAGSNRYRVSA